MAMDPVLMRPHGKQETPSQGSAYYGQPPQSYSQALTLDYNIHPAHAGMINDHMRYASPIRISPQHYEQHGVCYGTNDAVMAENMLRRKTPNGTLNDAYQGSSNDINPMKHMVLPRAQSYHGSHNSMQFDSMLSQGPARLASTTRPYQTLPSVVYPPAQNIGPTPSDIGGRGPYGPYWHDGTYVPYRPNALRDPRFYSDRSYPSSIHTPHSNWQTPDPRLGQTHILRPDHPGAFQHLNNANASPLQQVHYSYQLDPRYNIPSPHHRLSLPLHNNQLDQYHKHPAPEQRPASIASTGNLNIYPNSNLSNLQPRDTLFNWALQTYRELLGFIHHIKRHSQAGNGTFPHHQGQSHSQPNFFPKPPSEQILEFPNPRQALQKSNSAVNRQHPHSERQRDIGTTATSRAFDISHGMRSDGSGWHSYPDGIKPPLSAPVHPDTGHDPAWPYSQTAVGDKYQTLRRGHESYVASFVPTEPPQESPVFRARAALSDLLQACGQAEWRWVDGINLGGCLAYGLGDYKTAQELYTKVLGLDARHLEATSNLAATLVALGRRQEAEQHWMKVVKHAPNHFEAVEHLVGLLCNTSRGKEAVKVIEYVERSLSIARKNDPTQRNDQQSEASSLASRSPCISDQSDPIVFDYDLDSDTYSAPSLDLNGSTDPGFGSSGYSVSGVDNVRVLALVHAKGNLLYGQGNTAAAARAFEDAVMIATGRIYSGIKGLVQHVLFVISAPSSGPNDGGTDPVLLHPEQAVQTARLCFHHNGELPGLQYLSGDQQSLAKKAMVSTTSNSLLSLAKIFQDSMSSHSRQPELQQLVSGVREILALYYLSLSLQPSPSTANNVGILLASVQQSAPAAKSMMQYRTAKADIPGVVPGGGVALALAYYNYGLLLDTRHAHLHTNLGSLLKDIGQLDAAIEMYRRAVQCDDKFDIALANLANAVKDKGRIYDAIDYYKRAVSANPDFAEAVCGLANALNSVCSWKRRGGIASDGGKRDRWHVGDDGMLLDATQPSVRSSGWIKRVVDIVESQLIEGREWGVGVLKADPLVKLSTVLAGIDNDGTPGSIDEKLRTTLSTWAGQAWEGARLIRLIERATKRITWQWYRHKYIERKSIPLSTYDRPQLPYTLTVPPAPTVLPFHTFTCPMSAQQIRLISQRNGYRISASTLRNAWLPAQVFPPPPPPSPVLKVGYVSSDFNNHPLAHLMQSVFGLHDGTRVKAWCYATTASDKSAHRKQIEEEAPEFVDASSWSTERLVNQIVNDGIHILVNLNGYTRGARNEVFAARPCPVQMSFMGFAGTLGAEWCDYLLADETAIPTSTLRPYRRNVSIEDQIMDDNSGGDDEAWVYGENIIYCRDTFFCCDHKQSAPDSQDQRLSWDEEQMQRWKMRKDLFPNISDDTVIFANFNQLYKIEPTTFRTWLRILSHVPNSILWLLRFPDLGETNLLNTARQWAGTDVASRIVFTDVAPKHLHISRAKICDLFLDTPECNAHTTAADVLWSGTPFLTLPRYEYKMCSRMGASILRGALPKDKPDVKEAAERDLIARSEDEYEALAVKMGRGLVYPTSMEQGTGAIGISNAETRPGFGHGRLMELRRILTESRWTCPLFDTQRWVRDVEDAYGEAWRRWVDGRGGDIWLDKVPVGGKLIEG